MTYLTRKAMPARWTQVLLNLNTLGPVSYLHEDVICNHLLETWWDLRFRPHTRPIYLPYSHIDSLCQKIAQGDMQVPTGSGDGAFKDMYRSTVPTTPDKRVCFFLHDRIFTPDNSKMFFPILFDYGAHTAYAFGTSTPGADFVAGRGDQSTWNRWLGPKLWTVIGRHLGWMVDDGKPATVKVVTKKWTKVCGLLHVWLDMNADFQRTGFQP